jgi:ABC-type multidrug transport system ATPase subunit
MSLQAASPGIFGGPSVFEESVVEVLNRPPGAPGHSVPGPSVGYMPQDLALYGDFTIGETLNFYGRVHRLAADVLRERIVFLMGFLDLPSEVRGTRQFVTTAR